MWLLIIRPCKNHYKLSPKWIPKSTWQVLLQCSSVAHRLAPSFLRMWQTFQLLLAIGRLAYHWYPMVVNQPPENMGPLAFCRRLITNASLQNNTHSKGMILGTQFYRIATLGSWFWVVDAETLQLSTAQFLIISHGPPTSVFVRLGRTWSGAPGISWMKKLEFRFWWPSQLAPTLSIWLGKVRQQHSPQLQLYNQHKWILQMEMKKIRNITTITYNNYF